MKTIQENDASFLVRVTPRARSTRFAGLLRDGEHTVFKIAVAAPPIDGRANAELISWLADLLDLPRSAIEVVSGQHSRNKLVRVKGCNLAELIGAIQPDIRSELP